MKKYDAEQTGRGVVQEGITALGTGTRPVMILQTIEKTIKEHAMLQRGDHLLIAVSGGPDSTALLHVMTRLAPRWGLRLTAAHLNHALRAEESERDEAFVRELCRGMSVPCICQKAAKGALEIHGRSREDSAREARYRFLAETADLYGAGKIATGHHRDDQAETLLINLLRGSGPEGLKGILPVRDGRIIRPLLGTGRSEILAYLGANRLPSVLDSSNRNDLFLRNRIRHDLIPRLTERFNPQISRALSRTAEIMRRENDCLQELVQQVLSSWGVDPEMEENRLPLKAFGELHEALQGRIIKTLTEGCGPLRRGIAYHHVQSVLHLIRQPRSSGVLHLPDNLKIQKEGNFLSILQRAGGRAEKGREEGVPPEPLDIAANIPGTVALPGAERIFRLRFVGKPAPEEMMAHPQTAFMDYDRIALPMRIRHRMPGDRMAFLGMEGSKKLTDYFVDCKIPRAARGQIPLLVDARSVIWIAGGRISERVKVTEATEKVLKVEMI
jgi:tRNA(Ile)-lysidine synthase